MQTYFYCTVLQSLVHSQPTFSLCLLPASRINIAAAAAAACPPVPFLCIGSSLIAQLLVLGHDAAVREKNGTKGDAKGTSRER